MSAVPAPTANPFAGALTAPKVAASNALAAAGQQREIAEVQAAMLIARMNPRDPIQAMDRILLACTRPTLAQSALYSYSRGGTDITGPSIRLAEAMAQSWGNFTHGVRELEQRNGESTVEAFAWDIETNTRQVKVFQVAHERHTNKGIKRLTDPRDIYELVANQGSRRVRACILGVIPGDVAEAAVKQCETTLQTSIDITPEFIAQMLERFAGFGVGKEHIETKIQRRIESMQPAQAVNLRKIYNSLKDGMSNPSDWFEIAPPPPAVDPAVSGLNDQIKQGQAGAPPPAARASAAKSTDTTKGAPPMTAEACEKALRAATTIDAIDAAASVISAYPTDVARTLTTLYKQLRTDLETGK